MYSTIIAKASEDRNKLASAIRVCLIEATGGKLCKSYATLCCRFRIFSPVSFHTPALASTCNHALHYACDGVCGSKEARKCNKSLIEDSGGV